MTDPGPPTDWKGQKRGEVRLLDKSWDEVAAAKPHHHFYGRPWSMGESYFKALKRLGVRPWHRVLDLGCGAGRLGRWLIPFLWKDRYCGLDFHLSSLAIFSGYEAREHDLAGKRPRLMHTANFAAEGFKTRFDVVLDLWTTPHLSPEAAEAALRRVARSCRPRARLITNGTTQPPSCWKPLSRRRLEGDDWRVFRLSA